MLKKWVQPLMYQTVALKVSIHCEGCKKKVKKVLQTIEAHRAGVARVPRRRKVVAFLFPENHDHAEGTCDEASGDEQPHHRTRLKAAVVEAGTHRRTRCRRLRTTDGVVAMTPYGICSPCHSSANASGGGGGGGKKKKEKGEAATGNANGGDGAGATAQMNPHRRSPKNPVTGNDGRNAPAVVDAGAYPPATAMSYLGYYGGGAGAGAICRTLWRATAPSHPHRAARTTT
ncbi:hypothetical protein ZWY2020_054681 [Hordeum vulgare]|nr:hypothetical protein ZWY2020_054681 [Hordeum vulgare]